MWNTFIFYSVMTSLLLRASLIFFFSWYSLKFVFPNWGHMIMTEFFKILQLQIVNRIQKLRKKAALEPTDIVEVYFKSLDEDKSLSERVLSSQVILLLSI